MGKVKVLRALSRMKQHLDRAGITTLPPLRCAISYLKQHWFAEFYKGEELPVSMDGFVLTIPRRFATHFVFRDYEPLTTRTFLNALKPGMTVVDVGAHVGYFTLLAAKLVGPTGKVHAVEPSRDNLKVLTMNVNSNGFHNVQIHPFAAGSDSRSRMFRLTESSDSHGFYPHPNTLTIRTVDIEQRPVDEIVSGHVHAIKIDVEGAEIEVLGGMSEILRRNDTLLLWVEWFPEGMRSAGRNPEQLPEIVRLQGFTDISVIDEKADRILSLNEAYSLVRSASLPKDWYANIYAKRYPAITSN